MKFIGLYGTVGFIAIRDFSSWGESDFWSDVWPAIDGVVCLSTPLEGGLSVSNTFTKRCQNDFKICTRDKFATYLMNENFILNDWDSYLHVFTQFFTINSMFRKRNKSTREFVPRFRRLENRSLSHFRSRLVASLLTGYCKMFNLLLFCRPVCRHRLFSIVVYKV